MAIFVVVAVVGGGSGESIRILFICIVLFLTYYHSLNHFDVRLFPAAITNYRYVRMFFIFVSFCYVFFLSHFNFSVVFGCTKLIRINNMYTKKNK